jgi:hypothetical protein
MTEQQLAICVDLDIRHCALLTGHFNEMRSIDGYRRLLEKKIDIKQVGHGLFATSIGEKEATYTAIEELEEYASNNQLCVQLFLMQSLRLDHELWLRYKHASQWENNDNNAITRSK